MNVSLYGCVTFVLIATYDIIEPHRNALQTAIGDPVQGLYNFTPTTPLQQHAGLRQLYNFGLYSNCAYVNATQGTCSNGTVANALQPYTVILADMPVNYTDLTMGFIPDTITFTNSNYLSNFSQGAYYLLLLGSICAALSLLVYVFLANMRTILITFLKRNPKANINILRSNRFRHSWHLIPSRRSGNMDRSHT